MDKPNLARVQPSEDALDQRIAPSARDAGVLLAAVEELVDASRAYKQAHEARRRLERAA